MSKGYVLVTGASSGIGEATARHLAGLGFNVFAGVRKQEDAERMAGDRIEAVTIDVAVEESVLSAARTISESVGGAGLAGLVNNAGLGTGGPIEFVPLEDFEQILNVNVMGVVRTTQALLPTLRLARGRIVNMSSIGGRVALPLVGPYAASKFALEGLSDSLRRELRPWRMHVALIEPGTVTTPIWDKAGAYSEQTEDNAPPGLRENYGEILDRIQSEIEKNKTDGVPPSEVAEAVAHALTAERPKTRYLVGRDAKARATIAQVVPDRVMDALIARAIGQRKAG